MYRSSPSRGRLLRDLVSFNLHMDAGPFVLVSKNHSGSRFGEWPHGAFLFFQIGTLNFQKIPQKILSIDNDVFYGLQNFNMK